MFRALSLCASLLLPTAAYSQSAEPTKAKATIIKVGPKTIRVQEDNEAAEDLKVIRATKFFVKGKPVKLADMPAGALALVTYNPKTLVALRVEVLEAPKPTQQPPAKK